MQYAIPGGTVVTGLAGIIYSQKKKEQERRIENLENQNSEKQQQINYLNQKFEQLEKETNEITRENKKLNEDLNKQKEENRKTNEKLIKEEDARKKIEQNLKKEKEKQIKLENDKKIANENWKKEKNNLIKDFCLKLKLDIHEIKKEINLNFDILNQEIDKLLESIKNNSNYKMILNQICRKYIQDYLNSGNVNWDIKNLNIILVGKTGAGKSTFINEFLKLEGSDKVEEGDEIDPKTVKIERYPKNSDKGITLTDTIGVEVTNKERGIPQIKAQLSEHFQENLKDINKAIHSIFYCVKNDNRCEKGEREFIKELTKLYQNKIPVIILITQYDNLCENRIYNAFIQTEFPKNEFPDLEIIKVLAKRYKFDFKGQEYYKEPFGLEETKEACKKQIPTAITSSFIEIISSKIKLAYDETISNQGNIVLNNSNMFQGFEKIFQTLFWNNKIFNNNLEIQVNNIEKKLIDVTCKKYYEEFREKFISKNAPILTNELYEKKKEFDINGWINDNEIYSRISEYNIGEEITKKRVMNIIIKEMLKQSFDIFKDKSKKMIRENLGNFCLKNKDLINVKLTKAIKALFENIK